jgi:hypothetical protein
MNDRSVERIAFMRSEGMEIIAFDEWPECGENSVYA